MHLLLPRTGSRKLGRYWHEAKDGDADARALFDRHYSRYRYKDGRKPKLFCGPGEKMVLLTEAADALFVWRKFRSADGQQGINCAIFRNESAHLSSDMILDAEEIAWRRWPQTRLFTYVKAEAITSRNPGYCFKRAGWRQCGITKVNKLVILEKEATNED
jgi:hypothetical protein